MELWLTALVLLILLMISALLSGTETALTGVSRSKMHQLEKAGSRRASIINRLRLNSDRLIGSMLIGSNMANIVASSLATALLIPLFGQAGVAYASIGMTILVIIFAEIVPKTYAINYPERTSLVFSRVILAFTWLLAPFSWVAQKISRWMLKVFGVKLDSKIGQFVSDEELRGAIDLHARGDESLPEESAMLRSILDLEDVPVEDIMIHRKNVIMVNLDDTPTEIINQIMAAPYTRIPVWQGQPDNIVGLIHARDLMRRLREVGLKIGIGDIKSLMSTPWFVPESTSLFQQLLAFRSRKEHFAHVIDEYGSFEGIVTLEDILEEIVGEISDEHDVAIAGVKRQTDGSYLVHGTVTLRDLNRQLDWELPDDNAATIAGLILHECRDLPSPGQVFRFHGFRFEIVRRQRNQITLIRLTAADDTSKHSDDY